MAVPTSITDCNATAANNSPAGSDSIGTSLDDYLRAHAAIIRQAYDALVVVDGTLLPKAGGSVTGTITTTHQIKGITPVANEDLARKDYVDGLLTGGQGFHAYGTTANQTVTNATPTKVSLQGEVFDIGSYFDSSTNYRFQPTVAGYYQIDGIIRFEALGSYASEERVMLYGTNTQLGITTNELIRGHQSALPSRYILASQGSVSAILYMNGSSDYVELWGYLSSGGASPSFANTGATRCRLSGYKL